MHIKKAKKLRMVSTGAFCVLGVIGFLGVFPITKTSDDAEATYVPATTTLSIVSSKDTASVDITPTSSTGTFATSAAADMAEFTVTTDNLTGYSLNILGTDTSGQLVNSTTGDTLDTIAADTTENDFRTGNASTYNNKWGYRLTVNSATTTNFFSAPTSTTTAKTIYTTTAPNTTADSYTLGVGARVDFSKPVGTYTNTFVLTAVANNITYAINYLDNTGDTITDLPAAEGSSNITASSFTLSSTEPQRTGYDFIGWCDGTVTHVASGTDTCAGTTYQAGDTYTFTNISSASTNTANLYAMWKKGAEALQNWTGCSAMSVGDTVTLIDSRDNEQYLVGKLADNNCWTLENLRLDISDATVQTKLDSTTTNATDTTLNYLINGGGSSPYPANGVIAKTASSGSWADNYANPYIATQYKNTVQPASGSAPAGIIGIYYNYCAASAGSYCYAANASSGDASQDICPAGWRMPTGGASGQYQALYTAYSSNVANFEAALSTPLSGYFLSGTAGYQGTDGYSWSSTRSGGSGMYILDVNASTVSPQYGNNRRYGFPVRCVMKQTMQNFSAADASAMAVGDSMTLEDERDGKTYTVGKLADGQIWMTSNLNLAGGTVLSNDLSDVPSANYYTLPTSSPNGFDDDTKAYVYNTGNETTTQTSSANNSYYSWLAATAGGKDASGTAVTGNGPDAAYSICPKGWRLPKSGNQSDTSNPTTIGYKKGDFYKLATAYGANLESSYYQNSAVFYQNAGPGTLPNFLLAGYYYYSTFYFGGTRGNYWSSSSPSSTAAYALYFYSSYVDSANYNYRYYGFSVRCVFGS